MFKVKIYTTIRQTVEQSTPAAITSMFKYYEEKNRRLNYVEQTKPVNKTLDRLPPHFYPLEWNRMKFTELQINTKLFVKHVKKDIIDNYTAKCDIKNCYSCQTNPK